MVRNNKDGRMVLDVASGSTSNSANVQLYTSNGTGAQLWEVSHDETGYATFVCVKSGKVLDVAGGGTSDGANVQIYTSNGAKARQFVFSSTSYSSARSTMLSKVQSYSSNTKYIILVDQTINLLGIYKGSKGSWIEVKY